MFHPDSDGKGFRCHVNPLIIEDGEGIPCTVADGQNEGIRIQGLPDAVLFINNTFK